MIRFRRELGVWAMMIVGVAAMQAQGNGFIRSEAGDSLALPTGKLDWVDPVRAVPVRTQYVVYPTPSRGSGMVGSCMVYTPKVYEADPTVQLPVIYYLHGGTGNQREARWMISRIDAAIERGEMEPVIVVSPQALPIGWYVNANVADERVVSGAVHDVVAKDLIDYIDRHYRTVASAGGRGIEGFSMGGRGALMMAFAHPDIFGSVSSVAGAVVNWDEEPLQHSLEGTFGGVDNEMSRIYFDAWHPLTFACVNAREIKDREMKVRLFVGDADRLYEENGVHMTTRFHERLDSLGIAHTYEITPGANHAPEQIFAPGVKEYPTAFWDESLLHGKSLPGVEKDSLPGEIEAFLAEHFPGVEIARLRELPDERGIHRELLLADGTLLKFNEHGNWILADRTAAQTPLLPSSLLHSGIKDWLAGEEHSGLGVERVEKVPRVGYDIILSDATTALFNTSGEEIER